MEFLNTKTAKDIVSLTTQPKILEAGFELDENYMYALTPGNAEKAKNGMDDAKASYAEYYNEKKKNLVNYTKDELYHIIKCIAIDNSTRTPNKNIDLFAEYIYNNRSDFFARLEAFDISLVDDIAKINGLTRYEKSLASKICAYFTQVETGEIQYAINDSTIQNVLPYYLKMFSVYFEHKKLEKCSYAELVGLIKEIKSKLPDGMGYDQIDHIIWYCYRNDSLRVAIAAALAF